MYENDSDVIIADENVEIQFWCNIRMRIEDNLEMPQSLLKKIWRKVGKAFRNAYWKMYPLIVIVILKCSFVVIKCFSKINVRW